MAKLFVVYLGGPMLPQRIGEDHEVVMVAANSEVEAVQRGIRKWKGVGKAHADKVVEITEIDGFSLSLSKK